MSGIPCPSCKNQLALDLNYIVNNPVCKCPYCEIILDFNCNADIFEEYKTVLKEIESIKNESKGFKFL